MQPFQGWNLPLVATQRRPSLNRANAGLSETIPLGLKIRPPHQVGSPDLLSAYAVAKAIGATPIAISEIIRRKRAVSAEMAIKLGRLFNVSPELWMGIQADYDLEIARDRSEAKIFRRVQPLKLNEPAPA